MIQTATVLTVVHLALLASAGQASGEAPLPDATAPAPVRLNTPPAPPRPEGVTYPGPANGYPQAANKNAQAPQPSKRPQIVANYLPPSSNPNAVRYMPMSPSRYTVVRFAPRHGQIIAVPNNNIPSVYTYTPTGSNQRGYFMPGHTRY